MPRQHPWVDLIFPQVPVSHLLEKYVVASPQGSPTRRCVSLQSEFKFLIFCVSRSAFVCTVKGLDSNKWEKKINRRQCMKCWRCVCVCMLAWMQICVCVCFQLEAERSCSGPGPDGIERGMKEKDKTWGEKRWKRETNHCAERNNVLLITVRRVCAYVSVRSCFCACSLLNIWMFASNMFVVF